MIRQGIESARRIARELSPKRWARRIFREAALSEDGAQERRSPQPGPIETAFFGNTGRLAHKWVHYLPIYDRILAPFRGGPVTMLEIGVSEGGSLEMWRNYFGPNATICGIDINSDCATRVDSPNLVRIGSQADPAFLKSVVHEIGPPNVILDDGSHVGEHQEASFRTLWPLLQTGGLYIIEDTHTAYWAGEYRGGYRKPGTAVELVKTLIDDMHAWHHKRGEGLAPRDELGAITVFDSIVVIEKVKRLSPGHYRIGGAKLA